jgi:hypothetical protein
MAATVVLLNAVSRKTRITAHVFYFYRMSFFCSSKYVHVAVTWIFRLFMHLILGLRLWRINGGMLGE